MAALSGLLAGAGGLVQQQQSGKLYPTATAALVALLGGVLVSQVLVNLGSVVAVVRANRKVARAERVLGERMAPSPAPASVRPPTGPGTATLSSARAATGEWTPTHSVPAHGLDAYDEPDPSLQPAARLDPHLEVQVTDLSGAWAHVLFSNGWSAWVNARELAEIGR